MGAIDIDDHGEFSFADFTLKFLKIVMLGAADDLFFDFEVYPLGEAFQMDSTAWSHTDAGIEEEILIVFGLFQANFALGLFFIGRFTFLEGLFSGGVVFHDVSAGVYPSSVFAAGETDFAVNTSLTDEELDSAQLNNLPRLHFVA